MNKIPFLHYYKNKNDLINSYYIALLPLLIFGFYKNGLLLYQNGLINLKSVFIPCYFYLISIIISFIVSKIMKSSAKENILLSLICASSISLNSNILFYPIILFISLVITSVLKSKYCFNNTSLVRIIIILSLLLNSYSYLNIGEKLAKFNYNHFDIFLGFGVGGLASTSLLLLIISFIILSLNKYYKKIITLSSSLTFLIISLIYIFITKNYDYLSRILNGTIYFSFIFVAADPLVSPSTKKSMLTYGILIGIITSLISLINPYESGYLSIFIISLFIPLINKITTKKYLQS